MSRFSLDSLWVLIPLAVMAWVMLALFIAISSHKDDL